MSVGIDLTSPIRFGFINTQGGAAFYRRVFTSRERQTCRRSLLSLAACFAAKEAVSKVLKTGLTIGEANHVTCHSIEISDIATSEPKVHLRGVALQVAQQLGLEQIILRRDDIDDYVVVYAIGAAGIPTDDLRAALKTVHKALASNLGIRKR
ncbi:MAG: 4'-phosphopantetheinyl transferase superfamily protein [Chloroflexi bacterium]|nr:4'-phosphopantetheinyl transferase superfamily protein [Chloroflexota bacterium]